MRVLGVDPGLTRCGLGVVDGRAGAALSAAAVDVVRTAPGDGLGPRLVALGDRIDDWLEAYRPDAMAVEQVFSQLNVRTVMGTAQVAGVAIAAAARRSVPVLVYTPSEVKAAVTGSGRADKSQVTSMVVRILRLSERPSPPDAADALALAVCAIWRGGAVNRLQAALEAAAAPVASTARERTPLR